MSLSARRVAQSSHVGWDLAFVKRQLVRGLLLFFTSVLCSAQQKGQWVPGQYGLNAGVTPDPGFTYENLAINYSSSQLNNPLGNLASGVTGTYSFWADENIFMFVPHKKILGGYFAPYVSVNMANGSLVADIFTFQGNGGGEGLADTFVAPVNFGWHFSRLDFNAGYAFTAPTGRYTPGASDNVGSGYWGNNLMSGSTFYITKDKGTSANLFIDWEEHGQKTTFRGTKMTPGQAFTMEWGLGQILPLDKKTMDKLLQLGFVGYDQWQVSSNSGTIGPLPASLVPFYSVHALGFYSGFIIPSKGLNFFFKYYGEVSAKARPQGRTIAFGGSWTLKIPKK
jgi:hypothetical protein